MRPRITVVDLFSGCGGLTLGVAEAARALNVGIDVRLAVDVDPDAIAVYGTNLRQADARVGLVEELFDGEVGTKLTPAERRLKKQVGEIDVLIGGPPCQGYSDLNNHTRRSDPRNALYARMARAAEVLKPKLVLIENVPTVKHDVEKVVEVTTKALIKAGYSVSERVVDISSLGAPQTRRRHVLLASCQSEVDVKKIVDSLSRRCELHGARSVRWAIGDLQRRKPNGVFDSASTPSTVNAMRIDWLFDNKAYDLPNEERPTCHQSDHSYVSMYGRLSWNKPAQTVTTGFGSMGQGRYVHPSRRRTITPHEAARLQLLPDFWDFSVVDKRGTLAKLIGNAVPPILGQTVVQPALVSLGFEPDHKFPTLGETRSGRGDVRPRENKKRREAGRRAETPEPSSAEARKRMQSTRQQDTAAELALREEVDKLDLEYVVHAPIVGTRSRPDLVFEKAGVAVFVDGCFWHMCPIHKTLPKANATWWREKLEANKQRDIATDQKLHGKGWVVLRFWEHENPCDSASKIAEVVASRLGVVR